MAECAPVQPAAPGDGVGFVDSFVDSPSVSREASPSKPLTTEKDKKRFSDDFSASLEEPTQNGIVPSEKNEPWENFDIVPDRSDTPANSEDEEDDEDEEDSKKKADEETKENNPASQKRNKPKRKWESFDDDAIVTKKMGGAGGLNEATNRRIKSTEDLDVVASPSDPRCGVDAETNQSQWTALNDTFKETGTQFVDDDDDGSLPFRRTQSMRADTHRAVRIVDALRQQRRLSNTSLDIDKKGGVANFANEDDLTRKLKMDREWDVFLKLNKRIPGTKTKWLPVRVSVKKGVLSIKKGAMLSPGRKSSISPAVVEDVILQHNHTMTDPVPRSYDRSSKLHQIKLQQSIVQEKRSVKRLFLMEHVTRFKTLYKIGSHDLGIIQNILEAVNEAVRQLPVTRARGVAYRVNEVFVDLKESSDILMNCDGAVLDRKSLIRIYIQAFLTGAPECRLILNNVEATLLQGKSLLTQGMTKQVRLQDLVLHPCVNSETYTASREIKFQPVDGSTFELLRCSIDPYISPPINVSCLMEYHQTQHNVKITSSFIVRKKHNLRQRPITNLVIRFPIPTAWSSLFLTEGKFGQQRSIGSTASLRGSFRRKIKTRECQIETHLGSARYEAEHQAIMWRIGTYSNTSQPHTFSCDIMLKPGMQKPDMVSEKAEVTYTVPGTSTGVAVKGFEVEGGSSPETWVKYEIQYRYEVQMFPDLSID